MKDKKTVAQNLGENLKRIRTEKGISRKDLAERLGVAQNTIASYENGIKTPMLEKVYLLAEILKVSVASLTGENDYADDIPNVAKIVDEKIFAYRLQRAYQMARDYLDSVLNYEPNFDKDGRIVVHSPEKIKYSNGVVSVYGGYNSVAFKSKLDFVEVMEWAERDALRRQINFNAAFRQIVFGAEPEPK